MVDYNLIKFVGDRDTVGKATAIIAWGGKEEVDVMANEVINDIMDVKIAGVLGKQLEFDGGTNRWTITLDTVATDIVITVDRVQQKTVLLADNDNTLALFRVVECIINSGYEKDLMYRVHKLIRCAEISVKKKLKKG